jgi:plastocyanin
MNRKFWRGGLAAAMLPLAVAASAISTVPVRAAGAEMTDATAKAVEVKIDNFTFSPARITVQAGTTVTWDNGDDIPHTVTSSTKMFKSKVLDTADKFSFTFATPGVFEYFCSLHPHMTGTIVVEAATTGSGATQ